MAMHRIQIDLDSRQFARLKAAARGSSKTVSEVIRDAIDEKLTRVKGPVDFELALTGAAGIWARRTDLDSDGNFVRGLRRDRRGSSARGLLRVVKPDR